ncbi:uncharacterized protein LOC127007146 isoform X3 [Eriocheir sinensis]|uniref:uncharacterized protein LOC127007146 isoform X3 n=1 Tax=Eriocheir sinensis TaxID=95602 RepID=UPI0021C7FC94|nr:uncharacterized protein LOC127007146 isoform X3 [Eriocheir sinensis]
MSVARVLSPLRLAAPEKNGQPSPRTSVTEGLATPLRSVLTCVGCGRRYDDGSHRPKFLSCFHTACLSCLRKGFNGGKVQCPTCSCVTEVKAPDSLPDNTQLCTILLNMSSLNLHEAGTSTSARDTCHAHAARINFWCDTCRMPLCRDCTVLAHREVHGHKVRDHDQAVAVLRAEVRSSVGEARTLLQETRRLRHDQRKYLLRQLDAARAYEKQLKSELKSLDNDKKEDSRGLDRIETDSAQETSLVGLHEMSQRAGSVVTRLAHELATAKAVLADSFLSLGKLHRSQDDLDTIDMKSSASGSPSSPARACVDRRSQSLAGHYNSRRLAHNGRAGKLALRPALSLESAAPTIQPLPRVYLDLSIEGIQQTARLVIELRPDMAPRLCENFTLLCTGARGFGYRGSQVFRCLPGWWLQGGDFQTNDGEGGRAALGDDELISAETTDLEPRPGAVEMLCMSTNEQGRLMVGSQFFIHVKKYSYTHVFAYVIDGLDLVDKMTQLGDSTHVYRPSKTITIADSGLLAA